MWTLPHSNHRFLANSGPDRRVTMLIQYGVGPCVQRVVLDSVRVSSLSVLQPDLKSQRRSRTVRP